MAKGEKLLTGRELGEVLGISYRTVQGWVRAEKIPYYKLGRDPMSPTRFRLSEVEEWLERGHHTPPGEPR